MERWKGFADFSVYDKVQEDKDVVSFYLRPFDVSEVLPPYLPGQFIAVRVPSIESGFSKAKAYTLSTVSNSIYYRISVKKDENISKLLCERVPKGGHLQITAPSGKFVLKAEDRNIVLIGGGIGITPMLTMAQAAATTPDRTVHLIYSTQNSDYHAFKMEMKALIKSAKNIKTTVIYTRPKDEDVQGTDYDIGGRIALDWMESNLPKDAGFYFCGPVGFMKSVYHKLTQMGIDSEKINYEVFSPGVDITVMD